MTWIIRKWQNRCSRAADTSQSTHLQEITNLSVMHWISGSCTICMWNIIRLYENKITTFVLKKCLNVKFITIKIFVSGTYPKYYCMIFWQSWGSIMTFDRHFQCVHINENISHLTGQQKCVHVNLEGRLFGGPWPQITYILQYECPTKTTITCCFPTSWIHPVGPDVTGDHFKCGPTNGICDFHLLHQLVLRNISVLFCCIFSRVW